MDQQDLILIFDASGNPHTRSSLSIFVDLLAIPAWMWTMSLFISTLVSASTSTR